MTMAIIFAAVAQETVKKPCINWQSMKTTALLSRHFLFPLGNEQMQTSHNERKT